MKDVIISVFPEGTPYEDAMKNIGKPLDSICTSIITKEELSSTGNYIKDITFINDNDLVNFIKNRCIFKVLMDYGYEIFQCKKLVKSLKTVTAMSEQYTIPKQKSLWLDDVRPTNQNGQQALNYLISNADGNKDIIMYSNIPIVDTAYYQLKSLYEALYNSDNSFVNRWGGNGIETLRRGNKVTMNTSIGGDTKLSIREGKNLKGFSDTKDLDSYVTKAIGKAYNGIKGNYIESPLINNYKDIHFAVFDYPHVKLKADAMEVEPGDVVFDTLEEVKAELDRLVSLEFSENNVDKIYASYKIDYAKLEDTEEYKSLGYAKTEKANIGDYVKVEIPTLGYSLVVRVVEKEYDVLKQKTKSIKLSNFPISGTLSSTDLIKGMKNSFASKGFKNINDYITNCISTGLENSHAVYRENEILMMDTKDINTARNVWRWNKGALAHSNSGYYSNDWNIGITQDGQINASMMTTGILTAILIKALEDSGSNMYINLSTGEIHMDKGTIGSNDFYIDITNQNIIGKDFTLNLKDGKLTAPNTLFDFSNKNYSFSDGNVIIEDEKGIKIIKGKIGNDDFYIDIDNQIIRGDKFYINLKDGSQNLVQAGQISAVNNRDYINLNQGNGKLGSMSYNAEGKVQVDDGALIAKNGDKYCKIESGQVSWNDGSRIINNNKHTITTVTGDKEIESLDVVGNTAGGVTLFSKAANAIINVNSGSVYISYNKKNEFYADDNTWIAGNPNGIHVSGSTILSTLFITSPKTEISGGLSVGGDKNCIQNTESFGKVKFSSVEDIGAYLTWREYSGFNQECIYETKLKSYSKDGYYSCLIKIPPIIQECIDTEGNYDVYINVVKSFANARLWSINKEYFLIKSDKPCRFNFVLTGRRKGFEGRSIEEQILEGELYKSNLEKLKLKRRADIKLRFKKLGLKPNHPLWEKCAREWEECRECYEG